MGDAHVIPVIHGASFVNNCTVAIGLPMALGAQWRQVVWMVLGDSLHSYGDWCGDWCSSGHPGG